MSTTPIVIDTASADYERRMAQAKQRAEWELGDRSWADIIIGAFLYPDRDAEALRAERGD